MEYNPGFLYKNCLLQCFQQTLWFLFWKHLDQLIKNRCNSYYVLNHWLYKHTSNNMKQVSPTFHHTVAHISKYPKTKDAYIRLIGNIQQYYPIIVQL